MSGASVGALDESGLTLGVNTSITPPPKDSDRIAQHPQHPLNTAQHPQHTLNSAQNAQHALNTAQHAQHASTFPQHPSTPSTSLNITRSVEQSDLSPWGQQYAVQCVCVTGIAASNIQGRTIHSMFHVADEDAIRIKLLVIDEVFDIAIDLYLLLNWLIS